MSRGKPGPFVAGFSLVEAIVAVALTAMIILLLSSVTGQWLPAWRRGFVGLQQADLLSVGLERIVQDVSAAEYVTPSADAPAPLFEGDVSSVTFVRSAIGPNSYPHLEVVRIAEAKDDRGVATIRTRAPFTPRAPRVAAPPFAFGDPVALVRAPLRILFAYAGPDRVWVANWKDRDRLPDAVRITVRDAAGRNQPVVASTAVSLKVTGQGVPKLEAQASGSSAPPSGSPPLPGAAAPQPQQ